MIENEPPVCGVDDRLFLAQRWLIGGAIVAIIMAVTALIGWLIWGAAQILAAVLARTK